MAEAIRERALADGLAALTWDGLTEPVRRRTALFILDTLGAIGGAREAPGVPALHAAMGGWETDGAASVLLAGHGASPATAALLNGASAHALEFDDQHDPARIHAFCVVLPAALAAAEAAGGVPGRQLLLAVAVGVEVFCRLGLACHDALGQGWHPTTMFGGIAGAAAAAKVWGLDAAQTGNALAIAYAQLCGNNQSLFDNVLSKRIGPGFAARNAVTAALLARAGLSGPRNYLDGKAGLFTQYARGVASP
ncbi:MAG: MmgE/PrpD family protein, partial [Alphaproteobacteria bacterium]